MEAKKQTKVTKKQETAPVKKNVVKKETVAEKKATVTKKTAPVKKASAEKKPIVAKKLEPIKKVAAEKKEDAFDTRFAARIDELKWLYCELYHNDEHAFNWLCNALREYYDARNTSLKKLDQERTENPGWYHSNKLVGMMMYVNAFAGNLKGVQKKLDYVTECGCNYLHLMPLLESPKGRSDGGYAVADFRKVQPELGDMEDLDKLTAACHKKGISCCMDFVMNHTSEDHVWAKAARAGDMEARKRYFFYDNWDIPNQYEKTVPQVFPQTAPGNFTWEDDCKQVVMTTFYPYQWDLNYANPVVFNDMVCNMLYLANRGIDIIRLDAVPYIWKQLGTTCRNLPQVHTLVRMMRIISEIVCPSVLLLGEVVMEPAKVVPYFGSVEKPECHMLYNVTTMATTWHILATHDVRLLKRQLDQVNGLPREYVFLNYLRCHDDIGWGLDFDWLKNFAVEEVPHKKFLNDYFTGKFYGSDARGELYNDDPRLGDARLCGTTASLCGIEAAIYEQNGEKLQKGVRCDMMLHAYMLMLSGIPVIYSGDEVGQLNDYSYHEHGEKAADSRYLHRGDFDWEKAARKDDQNNYEYEVFHTLRELEDLRGSIDAFQSYAEVVTLETYNDNILGIQRTTAEGKVVGFFNFSDADIVVRTPEEGFTAIAGAEKGKKIDTELSLAPFGFVWLKK